MKTRNNKTLIVTLMTALLLAAVVITSQLSASSPGQTLAIQINSNQVIEFNNGAVPSNEIPDGRHAFATNYYGGPVLITDVQVSCSEGICRNVAILPPVSGYNPPDRFHLRFGTVKTNTPKYRSFATGFVWEPGESLTYWKTGGGDLRISLIGKKIK